MGSVLSYACEGWGWNDAKEIELSHSKYLRSLIHDKTSTPKCTLYNEFGCTSLKDRRRGAILKFWAKHIYVK